MHFHRISSTAMRGVLILVLGTVIAILSWFYFPRPASAASTFVSCTPIQVMNYGARIHVRCASPINGISYFAASTKDSAFVARTLMLLSTAQVAGRSLTILYDPADQSGAAIGCQTNDCRLIQAAGFGQ